MKRHIRAALAAALLAPCLLSVGVRAQDDAPPPSDQAARPRKDGDMGARMKERLGLSDEQVAKFQDAMKAHRAAMKAQGQKVRAAIKKLAEDVKAKAKDEDITADLAALKDARRGMLDENGKFEDGLASFLTPTQRAKMALGMARMMNRRRQDMRGRRGGKRMGGGGQ